ncbi:MAG: hypothetical protein QW463_01300 [Candidatus Caldarchaeum sp.]
MDVTERDEFSVGSYFGSGSRRKKILDVIRLSNGWILLKTENSKSAKDFKVRTVYQTYPRIRSYTPKHAHFAIDFYGKVCSNQSLAFRLLECILQVWSRKASPQRVIDENQNVLATLPGYSLEYIVYALDWIFDQEDVNFTGRPSKKQKEIEDKLMSLRIPILTNRLGSQLALSLFCDIALGTHPVEALLRANLDILPAKKGRGTK